MLPPEVRAGLSSRLRRRGIWAAALAFYAAYATFNLKEDLAAGLVTRGWPWVSELLIPWVLIGGTIWLGPMAWEWGEDGGRPPGFWKGLFRSAAFAASWMVLIAFLGALFRRMGGLPWSFGSELPVYLGFQGPLVVLVSGLMAGRDRAVREQARAQALARESQAKMLQGQLNPHVLFNALNGLAELTLREPVAAERSIRALAGFMRKVLDATEEGRYTLGDERAMIQDYLDAEGIRLGSRLRLAWDWEEDLDALPVLPLLLQPVVENAIKHGIAPLEDGGRILLRTRMEAGRLTMGVWNTGAGLREPIRLGVGIRNVRGRLALAYGDGATFELRQEGPWTVGEIGLELQVIGASDGPA